MPIYMDRHNTVDATREVISAAHERDLATQGQIWRSVYNVLG